ncbi:MULTISPECIES: sigma 54-interacting transcriptional regulator [Flavobacteriaceae]|uniref:sigma 54-interacting transcriptional regulator n=1 Tax=Flavobacteriaceae TaxID=49546 RepID=UPI001492C943|nr:MULTISPECIES: sigma 54-interacting transcriptional regulator [Allomuricauda]MDC6365126.1 sigma 54-interacting transcriptional regulator [Muricauda sp. AC10]
MTAERLNQLVDFLKKVPFFSEVEKASLLELCESSQEERFVKNNRIIQKGELADGMYVLLSGKVKVHDKEHLYSILSVGDCFGEYALIDEKPRSVSVTSIEETKLLKIESTRFSELMDADKGFAKGILSVLIKRHRELDIIQERLSASKEEVELANAKMMGLIDGAMDAIVMFDQNFRIVLANASAQIIFENDDVLQRNVLFFFDEDGAQLLESLVKDDIEGEGDGLNTYLSRIVKVIGSEEKVTLNEGTISRYGKQTNRFYTLILRNINDRLLAEDKILTLKTQTKYLEEEIKELSNDHGIIGQHPSMKNLLGLIGQVAPTKATVLIHGETGTGKELVARAIHAASDRSAGPMIRINCGAIPANLIESEFFGHEKGAFTGATANRKGRFLLADKGTIFLDEIGELPMDLQPKLLRVIQEGEFDPVGSSITQKVDVRIIAATHRNLLELSKKGKFREDLYYRLNVFPLEVPSLRERGNDICLIAGEMLQNLSRKLNKDIKPLTGAQQKLLLRYEWPGNVRELQNLVERAVIVSKNGAIDWSQIIPNPKTTDLINSKNDDDHIYTSKELIQMEKDNILKALRKTQWRVSGEKGAAALLGIPPTTLTSKIRSLGIRRPI